MAKKFSELKTKMAPESLEKMKVLAECLKTDIERVNLKNPSDRVLALENIVNEIGWGNAIQAIANYWGDMLAERNLPREVGNYWVDFEIIEEVASSTPPMIKGTTIDRLCFIAVDCGFGTTICFLQCAYRMIKKVLEENGKTISLSHPLVLKAWKAEYESSSTETELKRVTIDFTLKAYDFLIHLSESLGVPKNEVIRKGLGTLKFLDDHLKEGWKITLTSPLGDRKKQITEL